MGTAVDMEVVVRQLQREMVELRQRVVLLEQSQSHTPSQTRSQQVPSRRGMMATPSMPYADFLGDQLDEQGHYIDLDDLSAADVELADFGFGTAASGSIGGGLVRAGVNTAASPLAGAGPALAWDLPSSLPAGGHDSLVPPSAAVPAVVGWPPTLSPPWSQPSSNDTPPLSAASPGSSVGSAPGLGVHSTGSSGNTTSDTSAVPTKAVAQAPSSAPRTSSTLNSQKNVTLVRRQMGRYKKKIAGDRRHLVLLGEACCAFCADARAGEKRPRSPVSTTLFEILACGCVMCGSNKGNTGCHKKVKREDRDEHIQRCHGQSQQQAIKINGIMRNPKQKGTEIHFSELSKRDLKGVVDDVRQCVKSLFQAAKCSAPRINFSVTEGCIKLTAWAEKATPQQLGVLAMFFSKANLDAMLPPDKFDASILPQPETAAATTLADEDAPTVAELQEAAPGAFHFEPEHTSGTPCLFVRDTNLVHRLALTNTPAGWSLEGDDGRCFASTETLLLHYGHNCHPLQQSQRGSLLAFDSQHQHQHQQQRQNHHQHHQQQHQQQHQNQTQSQSVSSTGGGDGGGSVVYDNLQDDDESGSVYGDVTAEPLVTPPSHAPHRQQQRRQHQQLHDQQPVPASAPQGTPSTSNITSTSTSTSTSDSNMTSTSDRVKTLVKKEDAGGVVGGTVSNPYLSEAQRSHLAASQKDAADTDSPVYDNIVEENPYISEREQRLLLKHSPQSARSKPPVA